MAGSQVKTDVARTLRPTGAEYLTRKIFLPTHFAGEITPARADNKK